MRNDRLYRSARTTPSEHHQRVGGRAQVYLVMTAALFLVLGGVYLYTINERAVYGYDMRSLERELVTLKKDNAALRLREAEQRSLLTVEAGSATLRMERANPVQELSVEAVGTVAYR